LSDLSENKKTESHDGFKTVASLFASPTAAMTVLLNTAFIHLALEFLAASEKIKARDPRTLLNVFRDAPGHVPTQMLHYLNGFYENLWENWTKSAEKSIAGKFEIIDKEVRKFLDVEDERKIFQEIKDAWENYKIPGPNPSPVNAQQIEAQRAEGIV
jgi:hypothetical protein